MTVIHQYEQMHHARFTPAARRAVEQRLRADDEEGPATVEDVANVIGPATGEWHCDYVAYRCAFCDRVAALSEIHQCDLCGRMYCDTCREWANSGNLCPRAVGWDVHLWVSMTQNARSGV